MGRYYNGDIEGKFWFAVQSSDDASHFGGTQSEPNHLNYSFQTDDIDDIKSGIKTCVDYLGEYKEQLNTFFDSVNGYNDEQLGKVLGIKDMDKVKRLLEQYARLRLGKKILKQVEDTGYCDFEAEL